MSGTMTATLPVRPVIRPRAARLGTNPSSRTAASTRCRVSGATRSGRLSARDTVAAWTPARAATSRIVIRCGCRTLRDPTRAVGPPTEPMTNLPATRLSMATLADARVQLVPWYERSSVQKITHLGCRRLCPRPSRRLRRRPHSPRLARVDPRYIPDQRSGGARNGAPGRPLHRGGT